MPVNYDTLVLAGGNASRFGGIDKGLLMLKGIPLIEHVISRLIQEPTNLIISANRNIDTYFNYTKNVVSDRSQLSLGPLSGIGQSQAYMKHDYLFILPCDTLFCPKGIADKLVANIIETDSEICTVKNHNKVEPLIAVIKKSCLSTVKAFLDSGKRSVKEWQAKHHCCHYEVINEEYSFLNINTASDLLSAKNLTNY